MTRAFFAKILKNLALNATGIRESRLIASSLLSFAGEVSWLKLSEPNIPLHIEPLDFWLWYIRDVLNSMTDAED